MYALCKQVPPITTRRCFFCMLTQLQAAQFLADGWGTRVISNDDTSGSMRMVQLPMHCGHTPAHADVMRRTLRTQHAIETQTALPAVVDGIP